MPVHRRHPQVEVQYRIIAEKVDGSIRSSLIFIHRLWRCGRPPPKTMQVLMDKILTEHADEASRLRRNGVNPTDSFRVAFEAELVIESQAKGN